MIFTFLLSLIILPLIGQKNMAYVTVDSSFLESPWSSGFEINGIACNKPGSHCAIHINQLGFDTIKYVDKNNNETVSIMKLRPEVHYQLKSNSCSIYTLQPVYAPLQGMTHFTIVGNSTIDFIVGIDALDQRTMNRTLVDEFYYSPPSANCPFAARSIQIHSLENEVVFTLNYHFLHGELLGVKFNSDTKEVELNMLGHIRDKHDYRYLYQNKDE